MYMYIPVYDATSLDGPDRVKTFAQYDSGTQYFNLVIANVQMST